MDGSQLGGVVVAPARPAEAVEILVERGEIAQLFTVDPVAVDQDSHGTQRVLGVMIEKHLTHDLLHQ